METHMKRAIGSQVLTYEEFSTYLAEIEACLNSRPLVPESNDPDDFTAITPAHFLIGTSLKGIPGPNLCNKRISLCDRWELLQQMSHFGKDGLYTI
ncbi:integrase catalytic domain-containing protein [Trichonephila clavipes]|nr:integrase catalytic domain-containing protein [Trichonephila clavipes]